MIKITDTLIDEIAQKVKSSKRGRCNYNFHKDYSDKLQRLLNVSNKFSYVRPHKHIASHKTEIFIVLKGEILILEFNDDGQIIDYIILGTKRGNFGVEILPGVWHSFVSLEKNSCLYEVKEGPYISEGDKVLAPWAPEEGSKEGELFVGEILKRIKQKSPDVFGVSCRR